MLIQVYHSDGSTRKESIWMYEGGERNILRIVFRIVVGQKLGRSAGAPGDLV
jgi:hypothetical protein